MKLGKIAFITVAVITLASVVFVMVKGLGLNPDLDFGAGAYYYADIPEFEKTLNWDCYSAKYPFWVYVLLFLAWGILMFLLWKHIDGKHSGKR